MSACFVGIFIVGFWYRSMWIGCPLPCVVNQEDISVSRAAKESLEARFKTRRIDFTKAVMCCPRIMFVSMCVCCILLFQYICHWYLEASGNATVSRACSNRQVASRLSCLDSNLWVGAIRTVIRNVCSMVLSNFCNILFWKDLKSIFIFYSLHFFTVYSYDSRALFCRWLFHFKEVPAS